jgi:hypothetical protein
LRSLGQLAKGRCPLRPKRQIVIRYKSLHRLLHVIRGSNYLHNQVGRNYKVPLIQAGPPSHFHGSCFISTPAS